MCFDNVVQTARNLQCCGRLSDCQTLPHEATGDLEACCKFLKLKERQIPKPFGFFVAFQDEVLYLYKAIEVLVASNQENPIQAQPEKHCADSNNGGEKTATTSVTDAPASGSRNSSSNQSSVAPPERRHSASGVSDWSQTAVIKANGGPPVKQSLSHTSSNNSSAASNGGHNRRHSLPSSNGLGSSAGLEALNNGGKNETETIALKSSCEVANNPEDEEEEEEEEMSETAALTAV